MLVLKNKNDGLFVIKLSRSVHQEKRERERIESFSCVSSSRLLLSLLLVCVSIRFDSAAVFFRFVCFIFLLLIYGETIERTQTLIYQSLYDESNKNKKKERKLFIDLFMID